MGPAMIGSTVIGPAMIGVAMIVMKVARRRFPATWREAASAAGLAAGFAAGIAAGIVVAVGAMPVPAWAQVALGGSPGSLYTPSGSLADAGRDVRASARDDVVTIIINESTSAVASGVTNTSRKSTAAGAITGLAGNLPATSALSNLLTTSNAQTLAGTGQTTRTSTLTTTISVRVVDVTPNGTLVVEGTKDLSVNSERQLVTVRGLVRPTDLTTSNTVQSNQVANLEVKVNGKGVVNDAIKRPFFLYRLLLGLLPF